VDTKQEKAKSSIITATHRKGAFRWRCAISQLDEDNRAQCNKDTPRCSLDRDLVSSPGGGRRAGPRAGPGARPGSVVGLGSGGSRSRQCGVIDRGGRGYTYGRSAIFDREIITDDGVAQFGGGDVCGEVEELYARVGGRSGRGGEARGLGVHEEDVAMRTSALRWAV